MIQTSIFPEPHLTEEHVVNVASIPHRSPFRYPGGKTWLVPTIRKWLISRAIRPNKFIEPFAGGGIISLTVAFENLAECVVMVEMDDEVSAVWRTILNGDAGWLADKIASFELTIENVNSALAMSGASLKEKAFNTILKNRIYHGGIMAPGSGMIKSGENGKGILSRWYPSTLRKRILNIAMIRDKITFVEGDGVGIVKRSLDRPDCIFFIDPPYTAAGKKAGARLYRHFKLDHEELFCIVGKLRGDFLMTYDNAPEIKDMAERFGLATRTIAMKNTHHAKMSELLISNNFDWL